jgi:hypothetical protein
MHIKSEQMFEDFESLTSKMNGQICLSISVRVEVLDKGRKQRKLFLKHK